MLHKTKSVIIGRKKKENLDDDQKRPCFIALFGMNDPHKKPVSPKEILEFKEIHKIVINGLDINYLLPGNDLVINNLEYVDVEQEGPHLFVKGKQKRMLQTP